MRLLDNINRYLAFKIKEAEFRVHTWRRAKEISRAYGDARPAPKARPEKIKPVRIKAARAKPEKIKPARAERIKPEKIKPMRAERAKTKRLKPVKIAPERAKTRKIRVERATARLDFDTLRPRAVKAAKVAAAAVAAAAVVFGAVKVAPHISIPVAAKAVSGQPSADSGRYGGYGDDVPPSVQDIPEDAVWPEAAVMPEGYADHSAQTPSAGNVTAADAAQAAPQAPPPAPPSGKPVADAFKAGMPRGLTELNRLIFADKSARILYLFKETPGGWEIERAYPMVTGENEGPKRVEGDKKTPQGVYFIVGRKHNSELTNIYGPAAFILDYPNEEDRREGRTGHGIWIHGSERGNIPPLFTQGCLAVSNPDILDLAGVIRNGIGIPVVIVSGLEEGRKHLASVDFGRLKARGQEVAAYHSGRQAEFEKLVADWKTAWESKDIDAYTAFYSTASFANGAQKWDAYREHKMRTFAMYASINIDITDIALTELTHNMATVKFNQLYVTNVNRMDNAKRLIFRKEQDSWKIYREIPFSKQELLL
jgi:murein L,D-transpeptidase YafK